MSAKVAGDCPGFQAQALRPVRLHQAEKIKLTCDKEQKTGMSAVAQLLSLCTVCLVLAFASLCCELPQQGSCGCPVVWFMAARLQEQEDN